MDSTATRRLYRLFGELLDYPTGSLAALSQQCTEALESGFPEAAEQMRAFMDFVEREGQERTEELYTRTFEITPQANLYVGYHLFGESFKRGAFLSRLQEQYERSGFTPGVELADHLSVVLRFASVAADPEFLEPLIDEGILPAFEKVAEAFVERGDGYGLVISAARSFLGIARRTAVAVGGA